MPLLTSLFNLFYTVYGACFYAVGEVVELIWSAEGARMGCVLGTFGFDLALQGPLLRCAAKTTCCGALSYARLQPGPVAAHRPQ